MFQNFDAPAGGAHHAARLAALRGWLAEAGLDGVIIPRADVHQGEYVAPCDERLAWATGFTGSAGAAVVVVVVVAVAVAVAGFAAAGAAPPERAGPSVGDPPSPRSPASRFCISWAVSICPSGSFSFVRVRCRCPCLCQRLKGNSWMKRQATKSCSGRVALD